MSVVNALRPYCGGDINDGKNKYAMVWFDGLKDHWILSMSDPGYESMFATLLVATTNKLPVFYQPKLNTRELWFVHIGDTL